MLQAIANIMASKMMLEANGIIIGVHSLHSDSWPVTTHMVASMPKKLAPLNHCHGPMDQHDFMLFGKPLPIWGCNFYGQPRGLQSLPGSVSSLHPWSRHQTSTRPLSGTTQGLLPMMDVQYRAWSYTVVPYMRLICTNILLFAFDWRGPGFGA